MKILSKFADYYDFSCGYHSNETTYDRKLIVEEDVSLINKLKSYFSSLPYSNYKDNHKDVELRYTYGFVVVANVVYPFVKITKREYINYSYENTVSKIFYEHSEELESFYGEWSYSKLKNFFKDVPVVDFKYPVAIVQSSYIDVDNSLADNTDYKFSNKHLLYNMKLKDYKLPIDGRIVLQEIEVFLNKGKDELKDIITDDKVLLHAKGFDKNSFKKVK